jgi:hypothetical protein
VRAEERSKEGERVRYNLKAHRSVYVSLMSDPVSSVLEIIREGRRTEQHKERQCWI